ncbi:hypothetical protein [uncultured Clostridium sp.]|jgi:hypothetical protein|uniref:hypothetical protein n=1 Tax=uncultured Clostridium sp. TaxID=59620 RepID=UPI00260BAF99|nr:hypothetical protein [uncultured Clostridium sp.]
MKLLEKRKILVKQAVSLIEEYNNLVLLSGISENKIYEILVSEDYRKLLIDMEYGRTEFYLDNISKVYKDEMEGWGNCNAYFYEVVKLKKEEFLSIEGIESSGEIEEEFLSTELDKLYYIEKRAEQIYGELKVLEHMANEYMF